MTKSHADIIRLWPGVRDLATDLDVKYHTVQQWKFRRSIPPRYWKDIMAAAIKRDIPITYEMLVKGVNDNGEKADKAPAYS